jgi:hypothetical protein
VRRPAFSPPVDPELTSVSIVDLAGNGTGVKKIMSCQKRLSISPPRRAERLLNLQRERLDVQRFVESQLEGMRHPVPEVGAGDRH